MSGRLNRNRTNSLPYIPDKPRTLLNPEDLLRDPVRLGIATAAGAGGRKLGSREPASEIPPEQAEDYRLRVAVGDELVRLQSQTKPPEAPEPRYVEPCSVWFTFVVWAGGVLLFLALIAGGMVLLGQRLF